MRSVLNHFCFNENKIKNISYSTILIYSISKILFILVCFSTVFIIHGCEKNPVAPPETVNQTEIGTLTSSQRSIMQNIVSPVTFEFKINVDIQNLDSSLNFYKTDQSGNILSLIGKLDDNGDTANGDEFKGDGLYTGIISFNEPNTGSIAAAVSNPKGKSNVLSLNIYESLDDSLIIQVESTLDLAEDNFVKVLSGNITNYEKALSETAIYLQSQTGVQSAETDGTGIDINFNSGLRGNLSVPVQDANGNITRGGGLNADTLKNRNEIPLNYLEEIRQRSDNNNINSFSENPDLDPTIIGNRNVFIYAPFYDDFIKAGNEVDTVINNLSQSCRDFKFTVFKNEEADVKALLKMKDFGFIVLSTHGAGGKQFRSGESVNIFNRNSSFIKPLLRDRLIGISKRIVHDCNGNLRFRDKKYLIYSSFIKPIDPNILPPISGDFPNSIILNSSCQSMMNSDSDSSLCQAFFKKGAKVYYGYDVIVMGDFAVKLTDTLTKRLARGKSAVLSYMDLTNKGSPECYHLPTDSRFLYSVKNSDMSFSYNLWNGNFEDLFSGWSKGGDARVIFRLGNIFPAEGYKMGQISTGLNSVILTNGNIMQCLKILPEQSTLSFKWNLLSEEFIEYVGDPNDPRFWDVFQVAKIKSDGVTVPLFTKTVRDIFTDPAITLTRVSPEIVFDNGDVYKTDWQIKEINISQFRGESVTLKFNVENAGDHDFDTSVLLDAIEIH